MHDPQPVAPARRKYRMSYADDPRRAALPRPKDRVLSTETVGDPDADDPEAAGQEGAAVGAVLGTLVGGPIGAAAGAAVGGAAGSAGETVDDRADDASPADGGRADDYALGETPSTSGTKRPVRGDPR
jgi:hypothetical protein